MSSIFPTSVKRQNVTLQCRLKVWLSGRKHTPVEVDRQGSFSVNALGWKVMAKKRKLINKSPGDYSTNL